MVACNLIGPVWKTAASLVSSRGSAGHASIQCVTMRRHAPSLPPSPRFPTVPLTKADMTSLLLFAAAQGIPLRCLACDALLLNRQVYLSHVASKVCSQLVYVNIWFALVLTWLGNERALLTGRPAGGAGCMVVACLTTGPDVCRSAVPSCRRHWMCGTVLHTT